MKQSDHVDLHLAGTVAKANKNMNYNRVTTENV